jgi:hypothetical protein
MKITIETKAVPDTGSAAEYLAALAPVMKQANDAIANFAEHRIDRKLSVKDEAGNVCGEIEILRF